MPRFRRLLACLPLVLVLHLAAGLAADRPLPVGEHLRETVLETPHPYPPGRGSSAEPVWSDHFRYTGARHLVFEFSRFDLGPGDRVEVRDPKGLQVQVFTGKGFKDKGGDFITRMILGDEAYIELYSTRARNEHYGYRIERITRGYSDAEMTALTSSGPEAICGTDDKEDAVCYETSFPEVYDRARAVVRIVMDGSALCTGWLVSCENHLMTNNHCTWDDADFDTQAELDRMEFQFLYEDTTCGGGAAIPEYSFMGGTWLENDRNLDYTLLQAPAGENPAATYGWLLIDYRLAVPEETLYIVGHPSGRPKEISLYSTAPEDQDNPDGFCEVFTTSAPVCVGGSVPEIGYYCDTEGGNSGSPVLSRTTNKVIALHHCANCANRGVRIQNIWDLNQAGANPLPACSLFDDVGAVELDRGRYGCSDTVSIVVNDGSLPGAGSQPVTIWSDSEPLAETVVLTEMPPGSGTFVGAIGTTPTPAVNGDGLLSLGGGDGITVRYLDADDGMGGVNVPRESLAVADCTGPVISGVAPVDVLGGRAMVVWSTDEPADSEVFYSASPPAWASVAAPELVTDHEVLVDGLAECTPYSFWVRSVDEAENLTDDDSGGQYHGFTTVANVAPIYDSGDTPLSILDGEFTLSTVTVTETEPVQDVDVVVNITHTYAGDLDIHLIGPNGVEIELSTDNGGSADHYTGTIFDDEAGASITTATAPFTGSFQPEGSLSVLDGVIAAGTWQLRVLDDTPGDDGLLDSWSLRLQLPPRICGPNATYASHASVQDDCAAAGPGDADGVWDGGEDVGLVVTVKNDGAEPLTGVIGVLRSLTPGAVVTQGTSSYPDLPVGGFAASLVPFGLHLSESSPCGGLVELQLDVLANEGAWSATFPQEIGQIIPGVGTALSEAFTGGIPGTWTIVDGGGDGVTWFADDPSDPQVCTNTDPNPPIAGVWAAADSDCAGAVAMDEELITPVLDLSSALTVTLEFDHYFNIFEMESADVDIRSTLTGGSWVNVATWVVDTSNPAHEILDLTAQAAGAADVQVRWHYYDANFEWYWYVDNVEISFTQVAGCDQSPCASGGGLPVAQSGLQYTDPVTLSWSLDAGATGGYAVYRGDEGKLPDLLTGALDSCRIFGTGDPAGNVVDLGGEPAPPVGGFYWYLVTGWNGVGEGPLAAATPGPRVLDSTGNCP